MCLKLVVSPIHKFTKSTSAKLTTLASFELMSLPMDHYTWTSQQLHSNLNASGNNCIYKWDNNYNLNQAILSVPDFNSPQIFLRQLIAHLCIHSGVQGANFQYTVYCCLTCQVIILVNMWNNDYFYSRLSLELLSI